MLKNCPECGLQVSDKALACPHCGYPMTPNINKPRKVRNKRKRLPNGFGQISEIRGRNLKRPFRVQLTVGKDENGRPICRSLKPNAYFKTYNDAYAALLEFNKNPYDLQTVMTVKELYSRWSAEHFKTITISGIRIIEAAWAYCSPLYDMDIRLVKTKHIKECMEYGRLDAAGEVKLPSSVTQTRMKSLLSRLFDYAIEYEFADRNYARSFHLGKDVTGDASTAQKPHIAYTDEEINLLWTMVGKSTCADMVMVQCYSGWRPSELFDLRTENINIEEWTFSGGMKTKAGKNRIVPIHSKIQNIVLRHYQQACSFQREYLFARTYGKKAPAKYVYSEFAKEYSELLTLLGLNQDHRPHDGRKHFVTQAKKYRVNEYAIKRIVGHAISDITEKIYTERDVGWLAEEMEKIK